MSSRLEGRTVVVTRPEHQADELVLRLEAEGAAVIRLPLIAIVEPSDGGAALADAARRASDYDWLIFTSANAVMAFLQLNAGPPVSTKIACVGDATANAVTSGGMNVDLVPSDHVAEALVAAFPPAENSGGNRVLFLSAAVTRDVVVPGLRAKGWNVDVVQAYRTVPAPVGPHLAAQALEAEVLTFTSPSTVEQFLAAVGLPHPNQVVASIGPMTSARLVQAGVAVSVEANPHTVAGLVEALLKN